MKYELKQEIKQDTNRKLIQNLGYIPFTMSYWDKTDEETGKRVLLPATINFICPDCYKDVSVSNEKETTKYSIVEGEVDYAEGSKWGYYKRKEKTIPYVHPFRCQQHLIEIEDGVPVIFRKEE